MVVVAMTSNPQPVDYGLTITSADLVRGQLNRPGKVRVDRIYTLAQAIAIRTFGGVSEATLDRMRALLSALTAGHSRDGSNLR